MSNAIKNSDFKNGDLVVLKPGNDVGIPEEEAGKVFTLTFPSDKWGENFAALVPFDKGNTWVIAKERRWSDLIEVFRERKPRNAGKPRGKRGTIVAGAPMMLLPLLKEKAMPEKLKVKDIKVGDWILLVDVGGSGISKSAVGQIYPVFLTAEYDDDEGIGPLFHVVTGDTKAPEHPKSPTGYRWCFMDKWNIVYERVYPLVTYKFSSVSVVVLPSGQMICDCEFAMSHRTLTKPEFCGTCDHVRLIAFGLAKAQASEIIVHAEAVACGGKLNVAEAGERIFAFNEKE